MTERRSSPLLDRLRAALAVKHRSPKTADAYVAWVKRFVLFHGRRHPAEMGKAEVSAFLSSLATERDVSASTQNQALAALMFLYGDVLGRELPWLADLVYAKRPSRVPVVMTKAEVAAVLSQMHGTARLVASLLYGAGLRLLECLTLRVKDIDFAAKLLVVRRTERALWRCRMPFGRSIGTLRRSGAGSGSFQLRGSTCTNTLANGGATTCTRPQFSAR